MKKTAIIVLLLLGEAGAARAEADWVGKKAPAIDAREWVNAEKTPTLEGLRGRPVLLVFWGLRCEVCLCMPVLDKCADLYRKYRSRGLEILGLHVHEASYSEVDVVSLKHGIEFPMGNGGYNKAYGLDQVPRVFLLDKEGVVVWQGKDIGGSFSRTLQSNLRDVDFYGEASLPKGLRAVKRLVQKRRFGQAIAKLIDYKADPKTPDEDREAAAAFQAKLEALGEREYLRATSYVRTLDPGRGKRMLERLSREYRGQPVGRKADIRLKEMAKDADLKPVLEAAAVYQQLRDLLKAGNARGATFKARFLIQKYPDTVYAKMTRNLLEAAGQID